MLLQSSVSQSLNEMEPNLNSPGQPVTASNVSGYIKRDQTFFFNLEAAVAVQRQVGYALGFLEKCHVFLW